MLQIIIPLLTAMIAGGLIGLERTYYGRPAGFRTHILVCMASSLLMLVTIYQHDWYAVALLETVRVDPTRMAQGIMTGIGFLGAGVIMKEGLSIRGLTTAASIWITAAIGILAGVGFYSALVIVTLLTLGTLSLYRLIESKIPMLVYIKLALRCDKTKAMTEVQLRDLVASHGFAIASMGYALADGGRCFEYDVVIKTRQLENMNRLSQTLIEHDAVLEFRIFPTGD
ncbi:MAG: MgtC/SapB family protein [Syntrophales bacterium]|nr:MgtC/SapB family protein [Syntrophales bacterium]